MIFWLGKTGTHEAAHRVRERLENGAGEGYEILIATEDDIQEFPVNLCELRNRYMELKRRRAERRQGMALLPVSIEIQFIAKIQNGRLTEVRALMDDTRAQMENARDTSGGAEAMMALMLRLAKEYGIPSDIPAQGFRKAYRIGDLDTMWNTLYSFASDICRQIGVKKESRDGESAALIKEAIDEAYTNCEMSIKYLADKFGLDGSMISRLFKGQYSVSFSDYLLGCRMRLACELLRSDPSRSATTIAEDVGYTNYLSFKRAFLRYQGVTPNEYRKLWTQE